MTGQMDRMISKLNGDSAEPGYETLNDVRAFIKRFCAFPDEHCLVAVTLWAAHAHMVENFHTTPRIAFLSPEPGSGKTRVLEVLDLLVPIRSDMMSENVMPTALSTNSRLWPRTGH